MKNKRTRLKYNRERQQMTQKQLAKDIGMSERLLGYWEAGQIPSAITWAVKIARVFGVSVEYLFGGGKK